MSEKIQLTPLMQQYHDIKKAHQDAILFFRLGDFYEMFGEDAKSAAPVLEIALTKRHDTPMCGVPHHAVNHYIAKLIKRGFRVAVCEQMDVESNATGSLFTRKVVHTITPGTLIEENLLNSRVNNYLGSIMLKKDTGAFNAYTIGLACVDISTGEFFATEIRDAASLTQLASLMIRYRLREIVLTDEPAGIPVLDALLKEYAIPVHIITGNLHTALADALVPDELNGKPLALACCEALALYVSQTRPQALGALRTIEFINNNTYLMLDDTAVRNLELTEGLGTRSCEGSLLETLDYTLTAMGARTLRHWTLHPLLDITAIRKRQSGIRFFIDDAFRRQDVRGKLKTICDLERTLNRLITGSGNARDLNAVKESLQSYRDVYVMFSEKEPPAIDRDDEDAVKVLLARPLPEAAGIIEKAVVDTPPISVKEGGIIRQGYNAERDGYYEAIFHGREWIASFEKKERERTGITNLKVGYTSVFGYFIEISNSRLGKIPSEYQRKQTLTNGERFITPELKEMEDKILNAESKLSALEYLIFQDVRKKVLEYSAQIQYIAQATAGIDTLCALAEAAVRNNYSCPDVFDEWGIAIADGRHPVVERMARTEGGFVPNDCRMGNNCSLWIITGPNMSGKSTFLRQTALIVLMAQMGSWVPARKARIGLVDRIFTRIGAADNLARGESTFLVEMKEMAHIIQHLTPKSLLILDEIGRGTSTYDGVSIAWSVIEHLATAFDKHEDPARPLVLFATHYFELTALEEHLPPVKNYNVDVKEWQEKIIFLHKIVPGSADRSYGVHVADLAGLPKTITRRAQHVLKKLESHGRENAPATKDLNGSEQMNLFSDTVSLLHELKQIDINQITPMAALKLLAEWKERFGSS